MRNPSRVIAMGKSKQKGLERGRNEGKSKANEILCNIVGVQVT